MKQLSKYIMRYFIIISLALMVVSSVWESVFDEVIAGLVFPQNPAWGFFLLFSLQIFLFWIAAYVFYRLISKRIEAVRREDAKRQNLLFSNIAHDLKNPLAVAYGYSRALQEKKIPEGKLESTYAKMVEKIQTSNELLDLVFDYSKLESKDETQSSTVDAIAILRSVIADRYEEFEQRNFLTEIELPNQAVMLSISQKSLQRVFANLIDNLLKYNLEGAKVKISYENQHFYFMDDGEVLTKDQFESLLEPFVRGDSSRSTEGSGLGLPICNRILAKHGFGLDVEMCEEPYTKAIVIRPL